MAITGQDLISPAGEVEEALFPGEDSASITARLDGYVTDAYQRINVAAPDMAEADKDRAAEDWAYHRAYTAVYIRLSAEPAQASLDDQGSRSYLISQIQNFRNMAQDRLQAFHGRLQTAMGGAEIPPSTAVPLRSTW